MVPRTRTGLPATTVQDMASGIAIKDVHTRTVARWAGHSVAVLKRIYAKCIVGEEERAMQQITEALRRS